MTQEKPRPQLQMIWPEQLLGSPPEPEVAKGYELRTLRPGDEDQYLELTHAAGFESWTLERLRRIQERVLPEGLFVIEHTDTGLIVATALAQRNPDDLHPEGGELGWVAAHPDHAGRGLGMAVCAAVTRRFLEDGFERIYIKTDDWRLPALKIYLKLGYVPFIFAPDMEERWTAVCEKLGWPRAPETWPRAAATSSSPEAPSPSDHPATAL